MIRSVRCVGAPDVRASLSNIALVHTKFRLHAVHNVRVVNEDMLLQRGFARVGRLSRRSATIMLDGEARLSAYGEHHWLEPGDVAVVESRNVIQMRQGGAQYASLALEWDPGWFGDPAKRFVRKRLAAPALERTRSAWAALRAGNDDESALETVLDVLHEVHACEKRTIIELREEVSERARALTDALDALLSNLAEQPMISDLCARLGISERQLNRVVREYNARYGFNSTGWIDTRNRRRLLFGATFMTVPGATAAYVARVVGYRSATAFTRALRRAGLPAPSEIAAEVERLGRETRSS